MEEPEADPPQASAASQPASSPATQSVSDGADQPASAPVSLGAPESVSRPAARPLKARAAGPVATLPGFEMLPEGGSRLFVEISEPVGVEEKKTSRTLKYVLKGAHIVHRNNENALVTVHFNTPVARARLLPSGRDLVFAVDLRAEAVPAWKVVNVNDGSATLQIDFPKGNFLPPREGNDAATSGESAHSARSAPTPSSGPTPASGSKWRPTRRGQSSGPGPTNPPPAGN